MPRPYCLARLSDTILTRPQVCQTEQIPVTSKDCHPSGSFFARFPGTFNGDVMRSFARVVAFPDSK